MKTSLLFTLIAYSGLLFAQPEKIPNKGESFIKQIEGKLDKAKVAIDKQCLDINGSKSAENFYIKGYVYTEIAKSAIYKNSVPNANTDALVAIKKCKELDIEKKYTSDCINVLFELSSMFYNDGISNYNTALKSNNTTDYSKALSNFENFFDVIKTLDNDQAIVNHLIESSKINKNAVVVYTAYCAQKSGDNEKAKKYYAQTVLLDEPNTEKAKSNGTSLGYIYYADLLLSTGDTATSKKVISKAVKLYPDNTDVISDAIDIYSKSKNASEMADFLQVALNSNPNNSKMLVILAGAFNTISKDYLRKGYQSTSNEYRDKAIKTFEKVLTLKPTDNKIVFNANYNLGILYYNPAVISYKKKDENNKQEYEYLFQKAVPYLENAYKIDSKNKNVINMLMKCYQTLNETGKAEAIEKELYK